MRILIIHNSYQHSGGEEEAFYNEASLLRRAGHEVEEYRENNNRIADLSYIRLGAETIWSNSSHRKMRTSIERFRPEIAHFHNTFPLISPAVYSVCHDAGIPVVQTLHNYRLLCPAGMLWRDGHVCEDCLPKDVKWPGVLHGCYRESHLATTVVTTMLAVHHFLGTWQHNVTRYIALSEFSRRKFVEGGLPEEKLVVKPNFVSSDPGIRDGTGEFALFVGRLSSEKGGDSLLAVWKKTDRRRTLRIMGDGPLRPQLERQKEAFGLENVYLHGAVEKTKVTEAMKKARFVVFPSGCYENFPLVIGEAYACGLPVIAPRLGAMAEIVRDGVTGLHFEARSAEDLAAKVEWAWTHPTEMEQMGRSARAEFEAKYTADRNYKILMEIYEMAICSKR